MKENEKKDKRKSKKSKGNERKSKKVKENEEKEKHKRKCQKLCRRLARETSFVDVFFCCPGSGAGGRLGLDFVWARGQLERRVRK